MDLEISPARIGDSRRGEEQTAFRRRAEFAFADSLKLHKKK